MDRIMDNENKELSTGQILRDIISYGGSTFAALVAVSIYTMTDELFIGNYVGRDGLGAMALVYPVTLIFSALGTLVEIGGSAVVSELIGEKKNEEAESVMRGNFLYVGLTGLFIAVVGHLMIGPFLSLVSSHASSQHITEYAVEYLKIVLWGVPFTLIMTLTEAFMRCIKKPRHVLYLMFTTSFVNVILDGFFMGVFGMGIRGAAAATAMSQVLGALLSFWYFGFSAQRLKSRCRFCSPSVMLKVARIGGGFAIAELTMFVTEFAMNGVVLSYDAPDILAAASVSNVLLSLAYMPLSGLDTGTQPLVTRLFAEGNIKKCLKIMRISFYVTMLLTTAFYIIMMVFPWQLTGLFLPENEEATARMIAFLRYSIVLQPCVGLSTWVCGIMAALEDEWRNIVTNIVPVILQLLSIYLLPKVLPIEGIGLNYSICDLGLALLGFILFIPFIHSKGISLKKIFH